MGEGIVAGREVGQAAAVAPGIHGPPGVVLAQRFAVTAVQGAPAPGHGADAHVEPEVPVPVIAVLGYLADHLRPDRPDAELDQPYPPHRDPSPLTIV